MTDDPQPSPEALLFALELQMPEMGGDSLAVKLSAAQSDHETMKLARRIDAFATGRVAEERERCLYHLKAWGSDDNDYARHFPETKLVFDRVSKKIMDGEPKP